MKKRKIYEISVIDKTYSKTISDETKFYTSDTSLELVFKLKETEYTFESAEIVLFNINDKSLITRRVVKSDDGFVYTFEKDIIAHYGEWKAQLMLVENGEAHVASPIKFRIENNLYNTKPQALSDVVSWVNLKLYAEKLVGEFKQAVDEAFAKNIEIENTFKASEQNRQTTFETAEQSRQTTFETNESERDETFNTNEATRQENETTRQQAEQKREGTVTKIENRQTFVENQFSIINQELTDKDVISAPEIIVARGGEETLGARLQKNDDRLSENTYLVGKYQEYKTLNEAFNQWKTDGMPRAFIHVRETLLEEYLNIGGLKNANRLTIMGDDKYTNVWKYTDGRYAYAPFTGGGNITIKNFTVIADHEGEWTTANGAYGLHIDHPNAEGEVIVEDCIVKSYQDAAIGSGTSKNQIITLKNVDLFHYAKSNAGGSTGRWHGAFFYHTSNTPDSTGQKLNLENVYAYSEYGPALALQSSGQGNQEVVLTALNVTAKSKHHEQYTGSLYDDMVSISNANGLIKLDKNNRNNNSDRLNFESLDSFQRVPLTDETGRAIQVTDFNTVTYGNFRGENALNAPNNRAFVGFALRYSSTLIVQYVYDVLYVGVSYRRQNTGGTWSAWAQINDVGLTTTTAGRPTSVRPGYMTFDTNLQKPIWWNGSLWKDASGQTV